MNPHRWTKATYSTVVADMSLLDVFFTPIFRVMVRSTERILNPDGTCPSFLTSMLLQISTSKPPFSAALSEETAPIRKRMHTNHEHVPTTVLKLGFFIATETNGSNY